jgi:hypothetical protein
LDSRARDEVRGAKNVHSGELRDKCHLDLNWNPSITHWNSSHIPRTNVMSEFQSELNVLYNKYLLQLFMNTELFKKRFPISALRLSVANLSLFILRYTCPARPRRRLRPCSDHTIRNLCRIGHNLLPAHNYTLCLDSRNPYYTYTHTAQIRTRHSHSCLRQNSSRRHRSIDPNASLRFS